MIFSYFSRSFLFVTFLITASVILPLSLFTPVFAKAAETDMRAADSVALSPPAPPILGQPITLPRGQTINDYKHPFMIGGMLSTLGVGAEFQYGLPDFGWGYNHFAVRGGINYLNFNINQSPRHRQSLNNWL